MGWEGIGKWKGKGLEIGGEVGGGGKIEVHGKLRVQVERSKRCERDQITSGDISEFSQLRIGGGMLGSLLAELRQPWNFANAKLTTSAASALAAILAENTSLMQVRKLPSLLARWWELLRVASTCMPVCCASWWELGGGSTCMWKLLLVAPTAVSSCKN